MSEAQEQAMLHPTGERNSEPLAYPEPHRVETVGGPMQVHWEEDPGISPHGMLTKKLGHWSRRMSRRRLSTEGRTSLRV